MYNINDLYAFLDNNKPFVVSTLSLDDTPNLRPFGAIYSDGKYLYIATNVNKNVFKEIERNNNIMLYALKYGTREWVRAKVTASLTTDLDIIFKLFEHNKVLYDRYNGINDPDLRVLKLSVNNIEKQ